MKYLLFAAALLFSVTTHSQVPPSYQLVTHKQDSTKSIMWTFSPTSITVGKKKINVHETATIGTNPIVYAYLIETDHGSGAIHVYYDPKTKKFLKIVSDVKNHNETTFIVTSQK